MKKPRAKAVSERLIKERIKRLLAKHGCHWFMPVQGQFARKGVSDFIVCCPGGLFLAIEAKGSSGQPTALQVDWLNRVQATGGLAVLVGPEDLTDLEALLVAIANRRAPALSAA